MDRSGQEMRVGRCRSSYTINVTYASFLYNQHISHLSEIEHIHVLV